EGIATTVPAHLAILQHDDFINAAHSTKWVEDKLDLSEVAAPMPVVPAVEGDGAEPKVERDVDVEVDGRKFRVKLWVPDVAPLAARGVGAVAPGAGRAPARPRPGGGHGGGAAGSGSVTVPMQGTIVKVLVGEGDTVEVGQAVCILEAMK